MSLQDRAFALDAATKLNLGDAATVLKAAEAFYAFLTAATPAAPAGKPAAATAAKPAGKKAATKTEEEVVKAALEKQRQEDAAAEGEEGAEGEEAGEEAAADDGLPASAEGVQAGIAKLLKANKRKEAIGLLKKFGAASASGIKAKDFAKFVAEVNKLLPSEEASDEGDLTA